MIIDDPLQHYPSWRDPQRVADLLDNDDLPILSYYVRHSMNSHCKYNSVDTEFHAEGSRAHISR